MAKRGVPEHPKTMRVARLLEIEPWAVVGLLECLWHWCSKYAVTGEIRATPEDVADGIRYRGDATAMIEALTTARWLERLPDGRLVVHDISQHADNTWKANLRRLG